MPEWICGISVSSSFYYKETQLHFFMFTVCRIFPSILHPVNTPSFLTRSFQMIFSILLQHHISKLPRYICSTLRSVHFQHHTKPCSECSILLASYLILSPVCWWRDSSSCLMLLSVIYHRFSIRLKLCNYIHRVFVTVIYWLAHWLTEWLDLLTD